MILKNVCYEKIGKGCDRLSESVKFYTIRKKHPTKKVKIPRPSRGALCLDVAKSWITPGTFFICLSGFFLAGAGFLKLFYPFGLGWFAASSLWDRRKTVPCFCAVCGGYLWFVPQNFWVYMVCLAAELCFFLRYPRKEGLSRSYLPLTVFTSVIVMRGLFLIFNGISDTLLVITLTESIFAAGLSAALYRTFEVWQLFSALERPGRGDILCILVFVGGCLMGMDAFAVYSVSPAKSATCLLILGAARLGGPGGGAAVGAALGVIPSLSVSVSPSAMGMYAFSGLTAGLLRRFHRPGMVLGYLLGNLLLSLYLLDTTVLTASAVETLIGAALFLLIPKSFFLRFSEMMRGKTVAFGVDHRGEEDYALRQIRSLSDGLSVLEERIRAIQKEGTPEKEKNIRSMLDHISGKVCVGCSLCDLCWHEEFGTTYKDLMRAFAVADANDGITGKDLPAEFRRRCCHYKEMVMAVNCLYELYRKNEYWQRQISAGQTLSLCQLRQTVSILNDTAQNMDSRRKARELLRERLGEELRKKGLPVDRVFVESVGEYEVLLAWKTHRCSGNRACGTDVMDTVSSLLGRKYISAECACGKGKKECCMMRLLSADALSLEISSLQLMKEGSAVCGDSDESILLPEGKQALLISDGMGSGGGAKKESQFTVSLVKDILNSGFDRDFAASILDYRFLSRQKETYATMDLCIVDRIRREAEFIKVGAVDSYLCTPDKGIRVIRGFNGQKGKNANENDVTSLCSSREKIRPGDIIVLASDGIDCLKGDEGNSTEQWLFPLLAENCRESPKVIGERIANKVVAVGGGKVCDDLTLTVARVAESG